MASQSTTAYEIRFSALKNGFHYYDYALDFSFFMRFPESLIHQAMIHVRLCLERKTREMVLDFTFNGSIHGVCDRCLTELDHPVEAESRLLVKIEDEPVENTDQIWYVSTTAWSFQLSDYLYESASLLLPLRFVCQADQQSACDERLSSWMSGNTSAIAHTPAVGEQTDPRWEKLKQLKIN
jgi:uncharacterized protein